MEASAITKMIREGMEEHAAKIARDRAVSARWDLDVAVFLFAVLAIELILLFQGIRVEIVGLSATIGLALGWLLGWRKGKLMYKRIFDKEMAKLDKDLEKKVEEAIHRRLRMTTPRT